jgi:hypothetical protein
MLVGGRFPTPIATSSQRNGIIRKMEKKFHFTPLFERRVFFVRSIHGPALIFPKNPRYENRSLNIYYWKLGGTIKLSSCFQEFEPITGFNFSSKLTVRSKIYIDAIHNFLLYTFLFPSTDTYKYCSTNLNIFLNNIC